MVIFSNKKGDKLWEGVIGPDNQLQTSELVVCVCIVAYIFLIPADAFFGIVASTDLWYGIDTIIAFALGITAYLKKQENNK